MSYQNLYRVVFTYAKIQIWKQFTTSADTSYWSLKLCLPMQRYKFESNSQPILTSSTALFSCVYLCKDTNLKAIHNCLCQEFVLHCVVFTYAKIQIWKQFTTDMRQAFEDKVLCLPMQRYKFESNSQQIQKLAFYFLSCVYLCKDTNLKAIHNILQRYSILVKVVFTYAKIQIWKQFTTCDCFYCTSQCCVYLCKDTNLKAIHNLLVVLVFLSLVVFTYAKIQIWKQFTTAWKRNASRCSLCLPMQRYKFESNSQQLRYINENGWSCVYLCKDTNLKAIHNDTYL